MDKSEMREIVLQLKAKIEEYEGDDEDGVVKGLMYAMLLIEHGKAYADERIKLYKVEEYVVECNDCGC